MIAGQGFLVTCSRGTIGSAIATAHSPILPKAQRVTEEEHDVVAGRVCVGLSRAEPPRCSASAR